MILSMTTLIYLSNRLMKVIKSLNYNYQLIDLTSKQNQFK